MVRIRRRKRFKKVVYGDGLTVYIMPNKKFDRIRKRGRINMKKMLKKAKIVTFSPLYPPEN